MAHERGDAREVRRSPRRRSARLRSRASRSSRRPSGAPPRDRRTRTRARRSRSAPRGGSCRGGCTPPTPAGAGCWRGLGTTLRGGIVTCSPGVTGERRLGHAAQRDPQPLLPHRPLVGGLDPNPPSSASDDDSPVPNSTRPPESRSSVAIRSATRAGMVERRRRVHDPVPEADALRALRRGGEEHLGRARVAVLLEEVVLDEPARSRCRAGRRARSARAPASRHRVLVAVVPRAAAPGARRTARSSCGPEM